MTLPVEGAVICFAKAQPCKAWRLRSEAELRATAAALDDLRGEAAEGLATEMGSAFASAGAAVDATRGVVTKVADALKAAAEEYSASV